VAEALPETIEQGYLARLDEVFRSGEAVMASSLFVRQASLYVRSV
jgi:hypothetical protein